MQRMMVYILMPRFRAAGHAYTDILDELQDLNTPTDIQAEVAGTV